MKDGAGHDIHPDQINLVIAMATGNSIHASEALLQDPSLPDNSGLSSFRGIRRLTGNVGYPGVVLLIPPPMPRVLQVDKTRGRFVQAYPFDGTLQNSFAQTSIHLKFTEFVVPLASARGAVDADVVLREALISVYDGSRWIADLDILQAFESPDLIRMQGCNCTREEEDKNMGELLKTTVKGQLKTISTWDELLLCRENLLDGERGAASVYGNWFARLSVAALASWKECQTVVLASHSVCFRCGGSNLAGCPWVSPKPGELTIFLV